jgi:P22_AR N-terminal domain
MSNAAGQPPAERPVEQLPVPLFDGVVLAARTRDGAIHLALRDLCETLSLALPAQRRRIQANEPLHLIQLRVQVGRQFRTMDFLLLDDVPVWIMDVQSRRVGEEVRERFGYIKSYLVSAVQAAFAQLTGLPEGPSRQIEDLRDLDRIDQALRTLEELNTRQTTIEASQDRARIAFRDLAAMIRELQSRVQTLEQQAKQRMSSAQRGTIYHLVQAWGTALAARTPGKKPGAAIRSRWQLFNDRFNLGTYTDLPAARYDEAIQFVKEQYRELTGQEIDAIEQSGLEFDE